MINIILSAMDKSSNRKSKEILGLKYNLDQMDLTHIFKTLHPIATKYTSFSSVYKTFSMTDHMLYDLNNTSLNNTRRLK